MTNPTVNISETDGKPTFYIKYYSTPVQDIQVQFKSFKRNGERCIIVENDLDVLTVLTSQDPIIDILYNQKTYIVSKPRSDTIEKEFHDHTKLQELVEWINAE